MSDWMIFAERLSEQMKKQGLSIRQLAERMGMTPTTIFRYVKGQRVPRASEILKASDALGVTCDYLLGLSDDLKKTYRQAAQPEVMTQMSLADCISRQQAIDALDKRFDSIPMEQTTEILLLRKDLRDLPSAQPDSNKYEYHYDHTDCIWFRPEARNRCPSTCAQYRDGWNDAMNYIFRDGKGYRPYRRDANYGE